MAADNVLQIVDDAIKMVDAEADNDEQKICDHDGAGKYVLGLDCSTQSLTVSICGVENGVFLGDDDPEEVTAPTLMFVEALDLALGRLQTIDKAPFGDIVSVSGSGQQHGSVFWSTGARHTLWYLDPAESLVHNICATAFRCRAQQCRELERKVGSVGCARMSGLRETRLQRCAPRSPRHTRARSASL